MIYYTSDLHLGNKNIIEYEKRPWKTSQDMNAWLIANWNSRVRPEDDVYVLGDFCVIGATKAIYFLEQLNGHIHLIRGNHDHFISQKTFKDFIKSKEYEYSMGKGPLCLHGAKVQFKGHYAHIKDGKHEVILCHYPILYWDGQDDRRSIHLYGHMHSRPNMQHPHKDAFNVGVDVNKYYPVTLDELLAKRKNNINEQRI